MRIKPDRFPEKVVDAGDRFHAGKPAAGHHEIEQRRPDHRTAFEIGFLQIGYQAIAKENGITQRFHREGAVG